MANGKHYLQLNAYSGRNKNNKIIYRETINETGTNNKSKNFGDWKIRICDKT